MVCKIFELVRLCLTTKYQKISLPIICKYPVPFPWDQLRNLSSPDDLLPIVRSKWGNGTASQRLSIYDDGYTARRCFAGIWKPRKTREIIVWDSTNIVDWANAMKDILSAIFRFLGLRSLVRASRTCKSWKKAAFDGVHWEIMKSKYLKYLQIQYYYSLEGKEFKPQGKFPTSITLKDMKDLWTENYCKQLFDLLKEIPYIPKICHDKDLLIFAFRMCGDSLRTSAELCKKIMHVENSIQIQVAKEIVKNPLQTSCLLKLLITYPQHLHMFELVVNSENFDMEHRKIASVDQFIIISQCDSAIYHLAKFSSQLTSQLYFVRDNAIAFPGIVKALLRVRTVIIKNKQNKLTVDQVNNCLKNFDIIFEDKMWKSALNIGSYCVIQ